MVDPQPDIVPYLRDAEATGMRIKYVVDTHIHADHISGARALAEATGAQVVVHRLAGVHYPHLGVDGGDVLDLANVQVQILHTPGHTPEHICLVVTDHSRGPSPWFLLTGHTLMVGDVGRPDLAADPAKSAIELYDSLFSTLLTLPAELEIYPGAFSGSVCGRSLSGKASSTIGFEIRHNKALQPRSVDEFVQFMLSDIPPRPDKAEQVRAYNMGQLAQVP